MNIRRYIYLTLLILFGLIFALLLSEFLLRIYYYLGENQLLGLKPSRTTLKWIDYPRVGKVLFDPNSQGWFVTPSKEYYNFIKINSQGFYDSEHSFNKPEGVYRILFLGDSFVASVQTPLQQTFFKQVEKTLKRFNDKKNEVIALGMGDTGTAQQLIALQEIGLKYQPDLVIHMFLTANDIKNNSPTLQKDPYRSYLIATKVDNYKQSLKFSLSSNYKLLPPQRYSERSNSKLKEKVKKLRIVELFLQTRQKYLEYKTNKLLDYPVDYHVYDKNYSKDYEEAWNITQKLIIESKRLVEESGGKYILVTLANNEQVNKDIWDGLKKTYPKLAEANLDLEKPDKIIKQFCEENQIGCLQMLPHFKEYVSRNPTTPTHYRFDGHWNQIGTDLVAKFLNSKIRIFK